MKSFVLRGDICYSAEKDKVKTIAGGYLVCEDGICRGAYPVLPEKYAHLPVEDLGSLLILPGMVDLHIHAPQFSYRGLGMDLELMDWLQVQAFPEETKYADLDYAARAYGIFADCMKKSATTRACIFASRHREATLLLMEQMERAGLVSYVGKLNMDQGAPDDLQESSAEESAEETIRWIEACAGRFENTLPMITPRFVPSCSRALLERLREIQANYGCAVQSHLSENLSEIELVGELFPECGFYGQVYDQYGLFGRNAGRPVKTVMAHCIYSSDAELEMMQAQDVFIAHCPASNINVRSGIAPIRKYLDRDMKLGLGSDVAGGQTESMFRAITDAIQVSKLHWRLCDQSLRELRFDEAFYLATRGGGEFFGRVGAFEDGYEFDAVVIDDSDLPHPQELNVHDRLERAVYLGADRSGVRAKFVRGRRVV